MGSSTPARGRRCHASCCRGSRRRRRLLSSGRELKLEPPGNFVEGNAKFGFSQLSFLFVLKKRYDKGENLIWSKNSGEFILFFFFFF